MAVKLQLRCLLISFVLCIVLSNNLVISDSDDDVPPLSKLSQNVGAPTLKFLYCYSCGYRKAFEDYVTIIQKKYPYITIEGGNFDAPPHYMFITKLLGFAKILVIMCVMAKINIFNYINRPVPSWWTWCLENRFYTCLMVYFTCNLIEGQLLQSGAFEISLNDVPVWSKLQTGRIPQPTELFQIIDNYLRLTDRTIDLNNNFAK
ncbi:PREDICTED: selT-like protein [Nicrophorus vespilloides]|uniref:SelT-like protein n=1 Tax=Nicrophorus vespilloides TaxID=110193 RepID=A0ABM1NHY4_NICVS|nr:PREDICTED: selT-like protein [Nicrophorus vespilloides]